MNKNVKKDNAEVIKNEKQQKVISQIVKLLNDNNLTVKIEHEIVIVPNTKKNKGVK